MNYFDVPYDFIINNELAGCIKFQDVTIQIIATRIYYSVIDWYCKSDWYSHMWIKTVHLYGSYDTKHIFRLKDNNLDINSDS